LPSFGEKLKQEREKRKITLEQISVSTKIGTRMLQALEEDKFNQLPGGIFNKGFVRAYSRFVGLDEDQTVADYLEASGDAPPVSTEIAAREDGARENAEKVTRLEAIGDSPPRELPWGLFAAALLLIALALSLWSHRRLESARQPVRPAPTKAAAPSPAQTPVEHRASGSTSSGSPAAGSPTGGSTLPVAPKTTPSPAAQDSSAATPAASPDEFRVTIRTREESWISTAVDGGPGSSEILSAGSERTVRGRKEIIVKVGNAGGVDLRFNGKKLDTEGEIGQVKTVTFGPRGIVPNAPEPPSIP
jgi:cytoskeleton protein RodZ